MDYPQNFVVQAIDEALNYGLLDLERIERMVLSLIAGDIFTLPTDPEDDSHDR